MIEPGGPTRRRARRELVPAAGLDHVAEKDPGGLAVHGFIRECFALADEFPPSIEVCGRAARTRLQSESPEQPARAPGSDRWSFPGPEGVPLRHLGAWLAPRPGGALSRCNR